MLQKRIDFVERINELYGTNISVDFSSIWKEKREEAELDMELKQAEIENSVVNYSEGEENGGNENEENKGEENSGSETGDRGEEDGEAVQELHESSGDGVGSDGSEGSDEELESAPEAESEEQDVADIENNVEVNVVIGGDSNEEKGEEDS